MNDRPSRPDERPAAANPDDPTEDPERTEGLDPGTFIGHEPERMAETIPGGIGPADERISAVDTQPAAAGEPDETGVSEERDRPG